MRVIDKLAWVRIENGRVLCARSRGRNLYYLPGGKREAGESDEAALMREIREELSVTLQAGTLHPLGIFEAQADGQPDDVIVRMTCFRGDYAGDLQPAAEIEEMAWLTNADRERLSPVTRMIFDWLLQHGLLS